MGESRPSPKLPVQQFLILAICRFGEPVAFTSVFPYLPEMIHTLGVPEKDVAKWVGIASAAFSVSQMVTAVPWGLLSDRVGRRPMILWGYSMMMIFSLMFGFSSSLGMVIAARLLIGLGTGNVGIIRTMVAELVPEKELQPRAFSLMPLVWTIGSIFGPAFGGSLANPAEKYPALFGNSELLKKYPFALPNIAVSVLFIIGLTAGALFLRETLESKKDRRDYGLILGEILTKPCTRRRRKATEDPQAADDERRPLLGEASNSQDPELNPKDDNQKPSKPEEPAPSWSQILTPQSNLILLGYSLLSLQSLAFDSMFPVFLNYRTRDSAGNQDAHLPFKFNYGLGIDSQEIGFLYTYNGIVGMIIQFLIYPWSAKRFGVLNCLLAVSCAAPFVYLLIPFSALFPTAATRKAAAFILMTGKLTCVVYAFPCLIILMTNSAPNLRVLGTLNGVATSVTAIGRAAGPAFVGTVFSFGVKKGYIIIPWAALALICLLSAIPLFWIVEKDSFSADGKDDGDTGEDDSPEEDLESVPTCTTSLAPKPKGEDRHASNESNEETNPKDTNKSPVPHNYTNVSPAAHESGSRSLSSSSLSSSSSSSSSS